jgi:hypothetical protein
MLQMTRKEWAYKGSNYIVPRNDVASKCTIYNPTIDKVEKGMMVRYWTGPRSEQKDGDIVLATNATNSTVLVQCNSGGRKQCSVWVSISRVHCVWSIGTYEQAMALIEAFNARVQQIATH